MITAAEYRAWAEESLKWPGEATTPEELDAHIRSAEIWLQSALRTERLSKQPPTTEYEWMLPPFNNGGATALRTGDQFRSAAKLKDEPTDLLGLLISRTTYGTVFSESGKRLPAPVKRAPTP